MQIREEYGSNNCVISVSQFVLHVMASNIYYEIRNLLTKEYRYHSWNKLLIWHNTIDLIQKSANQQGQK
jgi:hypothetical protein